MMNKILNELVCNRLETVEKEFSNEERVKEALEEYKTILEELKKSISDKAPLKLLNELDDASFNLAETKLYYTYRYGLKDGIYLIKSIDSIETDSNIHKGGVLVG